jgi:hypothetical protein
MAPEASSRPSAAEMVTLASLKQQALKTNKHNSNSNSSSSSENSSANSGGESAAAELKLEIARLQKENEALKFKLSQKI